MGRGLCGVWGEECHVLCPGLTCMDMWGLQGSDHNDVCHSGRLLCYRIYKCIGILIEVINAEATQRINYQLELYPID